MNEKIYNLAKELNTLLNNDPRFVKLGELEKKMENDEEVISLAYQKDKASLEYSDILKYYKEDSKEAKEKRNLLIEAKTNLETHPVVKEYNRAYAEVRMLLLEVNRILFKDFRGKC